MLLRESRLVPCMVASFTEGSGGGAQLTGSNACGWKLEDKPQTGNAETSLERAQTPLNCWFPGLSFSLLW